MHPAGGHRERKRKKRKRKKSKTTQSTPLTIATQAAETRPRQEGDQEEERIGAGNVRSGFTGTSLLIQSSQ